MMSNNRANLVCIVFLGVVVLFLDLDIKENLKSLAVKHDLDITESRQKENALYRGYKELKETLNTPELRQALQNLSDDIKTQNEYLESFTKDRI